MSSYSICVIKFWDFTLVICIRQELFVWYRQWSYYSIENSIENFYLALMGNSWFFVKIQQFELNLDFWVGKSPSAVLLIRPTCVGTVNLLRFLLFSETEDIYMCSRV